MLDTHKSAPAATSESILTVTAQQSRFHLDALDTHTSNEIFVKELSISVGQKELLAHADLHLQPGGHYVLVGRNGTGKSTLLRAIAEKRIPGIPWSLHVLLLGQTRTEFKGEHFHGEETVLEHVLRSDLERERLLRESEALSKALDTESPSAAIKVFRKISYQRLVKKVEEARLIAARRSGARGAKAKKELISLEQKLSVSEIRATEDVGGLDHEQSSEETKAAVDLLSDIQTALELIDAPAAESKARSILRGLGFSEASINSPMSNLSGGWKTRCDMASALSQRSDILLLDEPTNFLDLPSILWLQSYISSLTETTVVLVTHDRDFANAIGVSLLVLRNQTLELFKGNLTSYEISRHRKAKWMTRMKETQDKQKAHLQSTIADNKRLAKKSGDSKKLKQMTSRQKKLDERTGLQVSAKGGRFKLNRDMAGFHLSVRGDFDVPDFDMPIRLVFPSEPADLRFPGALVSLENVSFGFFASKATAVRKQQPLILKDINLTIHSRQRLAIVGLNGAGKSTLLSLICGSASDTVTTAAKATTTTTTTTGTITKHPRLQIGLFSQDSVDHLTALGALKENHSLTALSHLKLTNPSLSDQEARALLSGLGLAHPTASSVPLFLLSGGQKVRLALALALLGGGGVGGEGNRTSPPQLLVLDEVTTHLDADTITALAAALKKYKGAVLVVSHDRWFVRVVVEGEAARARRGWDEDDGQDEDEEEDSSESEDGGDGMCGAGVVYRLAAGKLKVLEGGMDRYEEICSKRGMGKLA